MKRDNTKEWMRYFKCLFVVGVIGLQGMHAQVLDAEFNLGSDISGNQTGGHQLDLKISHSIVTTTGDGPVEIALGSYKAGSHNFYVSSEGEGAKSGGVFNIQIVGGQVNLLSSVGSISTGNGGKQIEFMSVPRSSDSYFLFLKWVPQSGIQSTVENKIAITHMSASGRINDYGDLSYSTQGSQINYSGALGTDVFCYDASTHVGYMMYSATDVTTRLVFPVTYGTRSRHFIAVRYNEATSEWWYDDNHGSQRVFTPESTDVLVAEIDHGNDTRTLYTGIFDSVHGIRRGYVSGDLEILVNRQTDNNGGTQVGPGEFHILGSQINLNPVTSVILAPAFEVSSGDGGNGCIIIAQPQGDISMGDFGN